MAFWVRAVSACSSTFASILVKSISGWEPLSKTLAACGGYIAGSTALIDFLKPAAGGFVYSVVMPPVAATALAALEVMRDEPDRRLWENTSDFAKACREAGLDLGKSVVQSTVPIMAGDSVRAATVSQRLFQKDINVQPIIALAIPERFARFLSNAHAPDDIAASAKTIAEEFLSARGATAAALLLGNVI